MASARGRRSHLERPPRPDFGDYSTNAALLLAPATGIAPRELAERLGEALAARLGERLERFEVAGPGFLNLFLADAWHREALAQVLAAGEGFGHGGAAVAERIVVEFVSANPTGPMHVGHARNAAYGDALARVLAFHGHTVEREFYVNDAGSQVRKLGESVRALARGEQVPEDGYHGDYVGELAAELADAAAMEPAELGRAAVAVMMARIASALSEFRVEFDSWSYESALHEGSPSPVAHALSILEAMGTPIAARARCGCARPTMGTTRTGCSCAPAASTPTSPRTSPTTRTSASAGSIVRSTCGAPTTMAMWGA